MSTLTPASSLAANPPVASDSTNRTAHLNGFDVIEFRRYTITTGERARFAQYFEHWFPEAFQQLGAIAFGQFIERDRLDCFTWLRGFRSTDERARINAAFYYGPLWKEHAATMNDRIIDHTNVLLLKPLDAHSAIPVLPAVDPVNEPGGAQGIVVAQVFALKPGTVDAFATRSRARFAASTAAGARAVGLLTTLDGPNTFPQLPFRTDGPYLVWLGIVENDQALGRIRSACALIDETLDDALTAAPELIALDPTPRSRMRWPKFIGRHGESA